MAYVTPAERDAIRDRQAALTPAIKRGRSLKWQLRLWSTLIKTRDGFRCLACEATDRIQAHHIIRRTLFPAAMFDPGNGATLCQTCHQRVHELFNRRPDRSLPIGAEQGDDQDEWSVLFELLVEDAAYRGLCEDEFYHLGDAVIAFSLACQGYETLGDLVRNGEMSRIRFAHEIWRVMPEVFYTNLARQPGEELLMPKGASTS